MNYAIAIALSLLGVSALFGGLYLLHGKDRRGLLTPDEARKRGQI